MRFEITKSSKEEYELYVNEEIVLESKKLEDILKKIEEFAKVRFKMEILE